MPRESSKSITEGECSKGRDSKGLDPKKDRALIKALKHIDTFYEKPPPGYIKEEEERPEDVIPDLPENKAAREFLAKAPTKGLWMPLGKEVKVMQCWRCKAFGHRSGDKECPLFLSGNREIEKFRYVNEDPMYSFLNETKMKEKEEKVKQLQALLNETSSSDNSESTSSSDSGSNDNRKRKRHKKHKKTSKRKKHSKKSKKHKRL